MFFRHAGNCGLSADLPLPKQDPHGAYASLFAEELGLVMEVRSSEAASIVEAYKKAGLHASLIGKVRLSLLFSDCTCDVHDVCLMID